MKLVNTTKNVNTAFICTRAADEAIRGKSHSRGFPTGKIGVFTSWETSQIDFSSNSCIGCPWSLIIEISKTINSFYVKFQELDNTSRTFV